MVRPIRFHYPGAVYHVMAGGDGGKRIFVGKEDHGSFLRWLERECRSHGWQVHAWVLMGNHFHLLLKTPEPNLSTDRDAGVVGNLQPGMEQPLPAAGTCLPRTLQGSACRGGAGGITDYFKSRAWRTTFI